MATYVPVHFYLSNHQEHIFKNCYQNKTDCTFRIDLSKQPNSTLNLTQKQVKKIKKFKLHNKECDIHLSKTQIHKQQGGFLPLLGALTPLILKGLAIGAATAPGKTVVDKIAGRGTRIIGKQYEGNGTRIISKLYEGEGTRIIGKLYEGEGTRIIGKVYGSGSKNLKSKSQRK